MAVINDIDIDKLADELLGRTQGYNNNIKRYFNDALNAILEAVKEAKIDTSKEFKFSNDAKLNEKVKQIIKELKTKIYIEIKKGVSIEWGNANKATDIIVNNFFKNVLDASKMSLYFQRNKEALDAFYNRIAKNGGLSLSKTVWKYTEQFKGEIELALALSIGEGKSAQSTARQVKQYLNNPDKLFRRVAILDAEGKPTGKYRLSQNAKLYHPGQGIYRSSYQNAFRLAATEVNMAYRSSDFERWQQMDFVIGQQIRLSNNHTTKDPKTGKQIPFKDICDELVGIYPKTFRFTGWHPRCYDEESEVMTKRGWQYFKDVSINDMIMSLNPNTREIEWVDILLYLKNEHNGDMIHFYNRNIDCLVTPEHEMIYLNKTDSSIKRCSAINYNKNKGGFYRGCINNNQSIRNININGTILDFNLFCEFMGYWLSDGSTIRKSQICIAQQDANRINIINCIEKLGYKVSTSKEKINFYSKDICSYLKQFKTSYYKYIPQEIKDASKEQIKIFLDAFISCDGHIRPAKSFIGNRGNLCVPNNDERTYFTTSPQMASDIGELILKIEKRPSYRIDKNKGKVIKFKNGDYKINYDLHIISECQSLTATQFNKEIINYKGNVYDITLSANAIMYIRRKGKCYWGSNCRCISIPILANPEDFVLQMQKELLGEKATKAKQIVDMPEPFKNWMLKNKDRIKKAQDKGTLPYFVQDNLNLI